MATGTQEFRILLELLIHCHIEEIKLIRTIGKRQELLDSIDYATLFAASKEDRNKICTEATRKILAKYLGGNSNDTNGN